MDLLLTGRAITAREALAMGLVSRVVPREHYYEEALNICRELCKRPPWHASGQAGRPDGYETTLTAGLCHERSLHPALRHRRPA
jgi:enoyl-CoA hydratase